ncbi:hypothetical protein BZZ01_25480 [Nostocales cyanobacterium HT-58-2]|nr:hypothetical protein BZZ01_25480 [Nostocales cyanobacterium HT-58-2]
MSGNLHIQGTPTPLASQTFKVRLERFAGRGKPLRVNPSPISEATPTDTLREHPSPAQTLPQTGDAPSLRDASRSLLKRRGTSLPLLLSPDALAFANASRCESGKAIICARFTASDRLNFPQNSK